MISVLTLMGCEDLLEKNVDPNSPVEIKVEYILPTAQSIMMNHYFSYDVNANITMINAQYFSQTSYPNESNWIYREGMLSSYVGEFYVALNHLKEIRLELEGLGEGVLSEQELASWNLMLSTLEAFCYQSVTDVNGPAIYSEGLDIMIPTPKYDSQEEVYQGILSSLDSAIKACDGSGDLGLGSQDMIYNGDMDKWRKFANSLMLRMVMRVCETDLTVDTYLATIQDPANGGLIADNSETAGLIYLPTPSGNTMYESSYNDASLPLVASNTIYNLQEKLGDPRIDFYWENPWGDNGPLEFGQEGDWWWYSCINQDVIGWKNKYDNGKSYARSPTANFPGIFIDYAEVEFFLAEACVRGMISGDAKAHYENGIRASIEFYGEFIDSEYDSTDDMLAYLAGEHVNFDNFTSEAEQLKRIGEEKWLALWMQGGEAWAEQRRLDSPELFRPEDGDTNVGDFPTRLKFSKREKDINTEQVEKAIEMMGQTEDSYTTKLWWDVN